MAPMLRSKLLALLGGSLALALGAGGCSSGSSAEANDESSAADTASAGSSASGGSRGLEATGGASNVNEGQGAVSFDLGSSGSSGSGAGSGGTGGASGPACPGVEALADVPGTTCRSAADCRPSWLCTAEAQSSQCGGAFLPAQRDCETGAQCAESERCVKAAPDPCRNGLATSCKPACSNDSCAADERCVDGLCEAVPCDDGFSCSELQVCAPDRVGSDVHGCAPRNCNEGYVCQAGFACDAESSGRCVAVHCREGGSAACAINQVCDEGAAGRGCLPKPCAADGDCDCGACVHRCTGSGCPPGECAPRLWLCTTAAAGAP